MVGSNGSDSVSGRTEMRRGRLDVVDRCGEAWCNELGNSTYSLIV